MMAPITVYCMLKVQYGNNYDSRTVQLLHGSMMGRPTDDDGRGDGHVPYGYSSERMLRVLQCSSEIERERE